MVEIDLELGSAGKADTDFDNPAGLPLSAECPARARRGKCGSNRAIADRAGQLIRSEVAAGTSFLVEAEQLARLAHSHLHDRGVGTNHIYLPLVTFAPWQLRVTNPDPSRGDRSDIRGAELGLGRPQRQDCGCPGRDREEQEDQRRPHSAEPSSSGMA